jgi:succinyl-diaminopimelate desuccinylase
VPTALAERLCARTLELIDIPSESRHEAEAAAHVHRVLSAGGVPVRDAGDTCVVAGVTERGDRPLVLLGGHLDTVPAQGNIPGRIEDGVVHGLGAADMLGACAVMVELALAGIGGDAIDVGYVFFGREELPPADSALVPLLEREPGLRTADLAIMMEPTSGTIHAGCLGNVNATWTFTGRSGHSARPWLADNAIHRAAAGIAAVAAVPDRPTEFDGLEFVEVVSVTKVQGGIAGNVVPGEATAHVNFRYAPDRDPESAAAWLHDLCDPFGRLDIVGNAPSGPVATTNPLARRLRAVGDLPVWPKQAWTPVAEFAAAGVDAVNFGPGDPAQAHTVGEQVTAAGLVHSYTTLEAFARA